MKTLLLLTLAALAAGNLFAAAPVEQKQKDAIERALTEHSWKFDYPTEKNVSLRFMADGRVISERWVGKWTISGPQTVLVEKEKSTETTTLMMSPDLRSYEAVHFDGKPVKGRQTGDVARR